MKNKLAFLLGLIAFIALQGCAKKNAPINDDRAGTFGRFGAGDNCSNPELDDYGFPVGFYGTRNLSNNGLGQFSVTISNNGQATLTKHAAQAGMELATVRAFLYNNCTGDIYVLTAANGQQVFQLSQLTSTSINVDPFEFNVIAIEYVNTPDLGVANATPWVGAYGYLHDGF